MSVPTFEFLGFVAAVAIVLSCSTAPAWRRYVLLIANLAFFATFADGPWSLIPFIVFLAFGYACMRLVESYKGRAAFVGILVVLIAGFCWLKQYAFIPNELLLREAYVSVGLSYVFFRVVSVVVDAYQDALPERVGLAAYANYTLNFTSFVAGPIQLYPAFLRDEVRRPAPFDASIAGRSIARIVTGMFKVSIVSPILLYVHQHSLTHALDALSPAGKIVDAAVLLSVFPIYLYVNFSGYTDAVIGAARFLRIELPENFNRPFASHGYLEFWSRWHMSLSNWFKTYVYSPMVLVMMRRFPSRSVEQILGVVAYFITFFLVGVWHGQTAMFVVFGLLNGAGVSGNKLYQVLMLRWQGRQKYQALCDNPAYAALSSGFTYLWLALSVVFFWATWPQLQNLVRVLGVPTILAAVLAVLAGATLVRALWSIDLTRIASNAIPRAAIPYLRPTYYTALATIVVSVAVVLNAPAPHIVYKAF